jgi:hypothetical protein
VIIADRVFQSMQRYFGSSTTASVAPLAGTNLAPVQPIYMQFRHGSSRKDQGDLLENPLYHNCPPSKRTTAELARLSHQQSSHSVKHLHRWHSLSVSCYLGNATSGLDVHASMHQHVRLARKFASTWVSLKCKAGFKQGLTWKRTTLR